MPGASLAMHGGRHTYAVETASFVLVYVVDGKLLQQSDLIDIRVPGSRCWGLIIIPTNVRTRGWAECEYVA